MKLKKPWSYNSLFVFFPAETELPKEHGGHRSKKSKKQKKKASYQARMAKTEFFLPLCDLLDQENELQVEVGQLKVSSCAQVLSLGEICIRKLRSGSVGKYIKYT